MLQRYLLENGRVVRADSGGTIRVYADPTDDERAEILASCGIDDHTLASTLDPEEVPRLEIEDDHTLIIWKVPNPMSLPTAGRFDVASLGIVLHGDRVTIIVGHEPPVLDRERARPIRSHRELVLHELLDTVHHYFEHLRVIRQVAREVEAVLATSIGNEHLLRMFSLSESLVYYDTAIETNGGALDWLRRDAERVGFTADELDLLADVIIENTQCARQAEIYSRVLSGLMDARGNIINNNMNILLKNLTVINVVFLPLSVLAGLGGMSEFSMMTSGIAWWISYPLFLVGLAAIGLVTWRVLDRWMTRTMYHRAAGRPDR
jgi:magnesium transporter